MAEIMCGYVYDYKSDGSGFGDFTELASTVAVLWARAKGRDIESCGKPARFIIEGTALCDEHSAEIRGY